MADFCPEILILDPDTMVPNARINDYESFSWTHDWYGIDQWTIKINRYKEGVSSFEQGGYVAFLDACEDWCVGRIDSITKPMNEEGEASEQWVVSGTGIEAIFKDRICIEEFNESTTAGYYQITPQPHETAMRALVDKECITCTDDTDRQFTGLSLAAVDSGRVVSDVKLVLRGEGSDGSTTITDSSQFNRTITVGGNAQIDTAQFKFGTASILFDGTGDYVKTAESSDFSVGTGNLGVGVWVRFNALPTTGNYEMVWTYFIAGNDRINLSLYNDSGTLKWRWGIVASGTPAVITMAAPAAGVSTDTWYYIAGNKSGTTWTIHQDGVQVTSGTSASTVSGAGTIVHGIHYDLSSNPFNGWMDDAVTVIGDTVSTAIPTTQYADPLTAEKNIRAVTVGSVLEEWKKASGLSCGLTWTGTADGLTDRRLFDFTVWAGTDRSTGTSAVKLSVEFGNLLTFKYVWSILNKKNFLYVGGSGDEDARLLSGVYTDSTKPTGWGRREGFLDSTESTTTALCASAGKAELGSLGDDESLEFDYNEYTVVNGEKRKKSYVYGTHFENGDIVVATVADVASITARIIKVTETYDMTNGKRLKFMMGSSTPDLVSIVRAQAKKTNALGGH